MTLRFNSQAFSRKVMSARNLSNVFVVVVVVVQCRKNCLKQAPICFKLIQRVFYGRLVSLEVSLAAKILLVHADQFFLNTFQIFLCCKYLLSNFLFVLIARTSSGNRFKSFVGVFFLKKKKKIWWARKSRHAVLGNWFISTAIRWRFLP